MGIDISKLLGLEGETVEIETINPNKKLQGEINKVENDARIQLETEKNREYLIPSRKIIDLEVVQ